MTGNWGVSFVVALFPAAIAAVLAPPAIEPAAKPLTEDMPWRWRTVTGTGSLAIVLGTLAFGAARLQESPGETVRVGLVSLQGPVRPAIGSEEGRAVLQRYLAAIDALAAQGARIVVLPETAFALDGTASSELTEREARHNMTIAAGVALKEGTGKKSNAALAFRPGAATPTA